MSAIRVVDRRMSRLDCVDASVSVCWRRREKALLLVQYSTYLTFSVGFSFSERENIVTANFASVR